MKIILATSNQGKIDEFKQLLPDNEVIPFSDILGPIEIIESADTFKGNAMIKAKAIKERWDPNDDVIIISDDSGITVPALNNEPGIYSARYAGEKATSEQNINKLIHRLNEKSLTETPAFYTACIAIAYGEWTHTAHGWMHGNVINHTKGDQGFGYDPMFIPKGYDRTLGELPYDVKKSFSHRSQALVLAKKLLNVIV